MLLATHGILSVATDCNTVGQCKNDTVHIPRGMKGVEFIP